MCEGEGGVGLNAQSVQSVKACPGWVGKGVKLLFGQHTFGSGFFKKIGFPFRTKSFLGANDTPALMSFLGKLRSHIVTMKSIGEGQRPPGGNVSSHKKVLSSTLSSLGRTRTEDQPASHSQPTNDQQCNRTISKWFLKKNRRCYNPCLIILWLEGLATNLRYPGSIPGGGPKRFHDSFNFVFYIALHCWGVHFMRGRHSLGHGFDLQDILHFMIFYISWHFTFHDIWHFMTFDI